MNLILGFKTWS